MRIGQATLSIPVAMLSSRPAQSASLAQQDNSTAPHSLSPREEDYVYADFRALSAVRIPFRYINFTKAGVLEEAVSLLKGQTVYRDHFCYVDNWAGVVMDSSWDPTGGPAGENGPPGINCQLRIDAVQAPSVARGLLSNPPTLHSVSVGVQFEWEKSHPDMKDMDFWWFLGEEVDGKLVEKIVTKIVKFNEISVVWQGADPNAKRLSADRTEGVNHMLKEKLAKTLRLDPASSDEVMAAALDEFLSKQSQPQSNEALQVVQTELAQTQEKLTQTESEFNALKSESESLKSQAALGEKFLQAQRNEAIRLFKLVEGELSADIEAMLTGANLDTAEAYIKLYSKKAENKFQASCEKCGSTDVTRQSSHVEDPNPAPVAPAAPVSLNRIHG